jgi:hypothetical protein
LKSEILHYVLDRPAVPQIVKEFSVFYGKTNVRYRVHNSPVLVRTISQINPDYLSHPTSENPF